MRNGIYPLMFIGRYSLNKKEWNFTYLMAGERVAPESDFFFIRVQTRNEMHYGIGVGEYKVTSRRSDFCMKVS